MPNVIGSIPEFTPDEGVPEEAIPTGALEETASVGEGTEPPAESSSETKPTGELPTTETETPTTEPSDEVVNQLKALQLERHRLLREVSELRGQRREIKQQELIKVQDEINDIEGVTPEDAKIMEAFLKKKGYVTQVEANSMFYNSVKQEVLNQFLEKHPEYKPENDPGDVNWQTLQREIGLYKMPQNPHQISDILARAHKSVKPLQSTAPQNTAAVKRQLEVASIGSGGTQTTSSSKTLSMRYRDELLRGGWTEEDIKNIESNL